MDYKVSGVHLKFTGRRSIQGGLNG